MANRIELTAEQLVNLDLLIADKQAGDGFLTKVEAVCTPTLVMHIDNVTELALAAVTGRYSISEIDNRKLVEIGENISLNELLELRNNCILEAKLV